MGCDIHAIVEACEVSESAPTPDWAYSDWTRFDDLGRYYDIFGFLAGVRRDFPHIPPRGLPSDLSVAYREVDDDTFGDHSKSWLTTDEFAEALACFDALRGASGHSWKPTDFHAVLDYMRALERTGRVVRFVFGFDN